MINSHKTRKGLRLPDYDYSQAGAYFVTICTKQRFPIFGRILKDEVQLNKNGQIISRCWSSIAEKYKNVRTDQFIIMPNHFHGILFIVKDEYCEKIKITEAVNLGGVISSFKYHSTKDINQINGRIGRKIWQRNYYEHVIRNEIELLRIREYIENNPAKWMCDKYNPDFIQQ